MTTKGTIVRSELSAEFMDQEPRLRELLAMLTYRRPGGTKSERKFRNRWIMPLGAVEDADGNLWVEVGKDSPILFSSHTDTVHSHAGRQRVVYGDGIATTEGSNCLGADDTTGVWIMINMIRAGVPGTYVFHADEEIGGLGSRGAAKNQAEKLKRFQYAIAFDRRGYTDVITHQYDGRCASDAFARSFAAILAPLKYEPCDGGTFTDTANYAGIIPECTNLSIGYFKQHNKDEAQDCDYAIQLLDKLIAADWSKLVCEREPGDYDYDFSYGYGDGGKYRYNGGGKYQFDSKPSYFSGPSTGTKDWLSGSQPRTLLQYVQRYPASVADFLDAMGVTMDDVDDFIWKEALPDGQRLDDPRGHGPDADEMDDDEESEPTASASAVSDLFDRTDADGSYEAEAVDDPVG